MTEDEMVGGISNWMAMGLSKLWELVMNREAWCAAIHGITELDMIERLNLTNSTSFSPQLSFVIFLLLLFRFYLDFTGYVLDILFCFIGVYCYLGFRKFNVSLTFIQL